MKRKDKTLNKLKMKNSKINCNENFRSRIVAKILRSFFRFLFFFALSENEQNPFDSTLTIHAEKKLNKIHIKSSSV
jgi:hypothetical protein